MSKDYYWWVKVAKKPLLDDRLSLSAKGIFAVMSAAPKGAHLFEGHHGSDTEQGIRDAMQELHDAGYVMYASEVDGSDDSQER